MNNIQISPMGRFAVLFYKSGDLTGNLISKLYPESTEQLSYMEESYILSKEIYDKSVECEKSHRVLQLAIKAEKKEKKNKTSNVNLLSAIAQKEYKKSIYNNRCNDLRLAINQWFSILGTRLVKENPERRKSVYSCEEKDIEKVISLCNAIGESIKTEGEHYNQFWKFLIYSSGEILESKCNLKQTGIKLCDSLEKVPVDVLFFKNEGPLFDFKKNTLYIYRGQISCFRDKHHLTGVNAIVPTTSGEKVSLNATYCVDCNRFYISYSEYTYYLEKYKFLLTKFDLMDSVSSDGAFGKLADKSPLKLCGYTVSQEKGLSKEEREHILCEMISSGIVSKPEVMQYLEWFIHLNGKREANQTAREKWESDLFYVRNLNVSSQTNWEIDDIKPYQR